MTIASMEKTSTRGQNKYINELVGSLDEGISSLKQTMAAAMEPFHSMEKVIIELTSEGKDSLCDTAIELFKAVARDIDEYRPKVNELISEINELKATLPVKNRHRGRFTAEALSLGSRCIELNASILQTTVTMTDDYIKLLNDAGIEQ